MSIKTTNLGPRVSLHTIKASGATDIVFEVPSYATFLGSGKIDLTSGTLLSRTTDASLNSSNLTDGEAAFQLEVSSGTLFIRSGVTTYQFSADTATVI